MRSNRKKWPIIVGGGVVGLLAIGVIAAAVSSLGRDTSTPTTQAAAQTAVDASIVADYCADVTNAVRAYKAGDLITSRIKNINEVVDRYEGLGSGAEFDAQSHDVCHDDLVAFALIPGTDLTSTSSGAESAAASSTTLQPTTTTTRSTTTTILPTTTTEAQLTTYGPGTLVAGSEIPFGVYRTSGYWALLDNDLEIMENELVGDGGFGLLVVTEGAAFVEVDEAVPIEELPVWEVLVLNRAGVVTEGTYLVGVDIAPGRYRLTPNPGDNNAYAAALALQPDGRRDIITNELSESLIIDIPSTAWGFEFRGVITPI